MGACKVGKTHRGVGMAKKKKVIQKKFSDDPRIDLERRIARALDHPVRAEIIAILNERCAAPSDVEDRFEGVKLDNISYHFRTLHELRMIEPIDDTSERAGSKTVYRRCPTMLPAGVECSELSPEIRSGLGGRGDRHVSTTTLPVDAQGWSDLMDLLSGTLDRVMEIEAESAARVGDGNGDQRFSATVNLMSLSRPDGQVAARSKR
jgi:DNA-binding transcriptional ArsR family regulator